MGISDASYESAPVGTSVLAGDASGGFAGVAGGGGIIYAEFGRRARWSSICGI